MRLPRVTIRRLMILVVVAAIGTWAGMRARDVYMDNDYHIHIHAHWLKDEPAMTFNSAITPPYWPRYWRHLLGLPWKEQPVCGTGAGHLEEACSFAHPEIVPKGLPGSALQQTKEIDEVYARMLKHWENRNTPGWSPDSMPD
jgi:hypothetical protein